MLPVYHITSAFATKGKTQHVRQIFVGSAPKASPTTLPFVSQGQLQNLTAPHLLTRHHKAVQLIAKSCPGRIPRVAGWNKNDFNSNRGFAGGERSW